MVKNKLDCFGSTLLKTTEPGRSKINKKAYVSEWYISVDHQYQELLNIQIISFIQCLQHILKIYVYVQYIRQQLIKINIW